MAENFGQWQEANQYQCDRGQRTEQAGARNDALERFASGFAAVRTPLLFNFRSSPDLVRIQHVVARALDPNAAPTAAQAVRQVDGDVAQVWNSPTKAHEARRR